VFYRTDWEVVQDIFSIGYHVGALFAHSDRPNDLGGSMNGQMTNVNFDNVDVGLAVYAIEEFGALHICNLSTLMFPYSMKALLLPAAPSYKY
jgi:hypothetical protein